MPAQAAPLEGCMNTRHQHQGRQQVETGLSGFGFTGLAALMALAVIVLLF
jgi:hypothetical protein